VEQLGIEQLWLPWNKIGKGTFQNERDFSRLFSNTFAATRCATVWLMATSPQPVICIQRERLIRVFLRAVGELNRLQIAQAGAALAGDDFSYEPQIAEATRIRDNAKYAVLLHREEHGC
jgi:hypothetical protein